MLVASVERILVHLPLTERQERILPPGSFRDIRVVWLCKATLDTGEIGWCAQGRFKMTNLRPKQRHILAHLRIGIDTLN